MIAKFLSSINFAYFSRGSSKKEISLNTPIKAGFSFIIFAVLL